MAVLVTCKFDDDTIKSKGAIVSKHFLQYKSMGNFSALKAK